MKYIFILSFAFYVAIMSFPSLSVLMKTALVLEPEVSNILLDFSTGLEQSIKTDKTKLYFTVISLIVPSAVPLPNLRLT